MIEVHASRSPFQDDWVTAHVDGGQTVSEIAGGAPVFAWVDGREVPTDFIDRMRIKDGVTLTLRPIPQDDGDLRAVLSIVVTAAAAVVSGGTSLIAQGFGSYAAGAAIGILGTAAINQLVPPPSQQRQDREGGFNRLAAISGTSNQVAAFTPVPRPYGTIRYFPPIPMTAKPYTEVAGNKQFLRMYLVLGHGPLDIGGTEVGKGRDAIKRRISPQGVAYFTNNTWSKGTLVDAEIVSTDKGPFTARVQPTATVGTWTSDSNDFSGDKTALESNVTWDWNSGRDPIVDGGTDDGGTVKVEISTDGGSTWTEVSNGDPIPGITNGTDLNSAGSDIRARVTLTEKTITNSQGASTTFTPYINSITLSVRYATRNGLTGLSDAPVTIEETGIDEFVDVEYEIGRPDQMSLYTSSVTETAPGFNTTEGDEGTSAVRTTDQGATAISIDVAGRLFSLTEKKQNTRESRILFSYEYKLTTESEYSDPEQFWLVSNKRETARKSIKFDVPEGQYDVRLTRLRTEHVGDSANTADASWTALRTFKAIDDPFDVDNMVVMNLRIQATDQLSGRIEKLAVKATSVLPVWNGSSWVEQPTRTHAWILADIMTGSANRRPLDQSSIDTESFKAWADQTEADGDYYDNVFDNTGTTLDRMNEVASMGRASWDILPDTTVTVVRDIPQTTPKMLVSPRNSWGYSYSLSAVELPHALRVRYVSTDTWEQTERVVFDDGYDATNATLYETLEAPGVTDPDQAWRFGRYHLAQQRLRPERHSFNQDVQHLRYRRGNLIDHQHDVILVGIAAGRVKSVTTDGDGDATAITVDEFLTMADAGTDYGVKIQRSDGSVAVVGVQTDTPGANTVTLKTATPDIQPDDHVTFGESGKITQELKVSAIEPSGGLTASVTAVPAADEILDALTGTIPSFDPQITEPIDPAALPPRMPVIESIESNENVMLPDSDGSLRVRMLVETAVEGFPGWNSEYQIRYRASVESDWIWLPANREGAFSVFDIDVGVQYDVQARTIRDGIASDWTATTQHTVEGDTSAPADVANFTANVTPLGFLELSWSNNVETDISYYEIRKGSPTWSSAEVVARVSATGFSPNNPSAETWLIKAVTRAGTESANAATVTVNNELDYGDNVKNPGFEDGQWKWSFGTSWSISQDYSGTRSGSNTAKVTETGGASRDIESSRVLASDGDKIGCAAWVILETAFDGELALFLVFYDASDSEISASEVDSNSTRTQNFIQMSGFVNNAPANTAGAALRMRSRNQTAGAAHVDDVRIAILQSNEDIDATETTNGPSMPDADNTEKVLDTLMPNPSFETGDPASEVFADTTEISIVQDAANAYDGDYVAKADLTGTARNHVQKNVASIKPGKAYRVAFVAKGGTDGSVSPRVEWLDSNGSEIYAATSGFDGLARIQSGSSVYQEVSSVFVAPDNAQRARFGWQFAFSPNGTWYLDSRDVEQVPLPLELRFDPDDLLLNSEFSQTDDDGNPIAIRPVESITDFSELNVAGLGIEITNSADSNVAYGFRAIDIDDSARYLITITHKSSADANGLSLVLHEESSKPAKDYIGHDDGAGLNADVQERASVVKVVDGGDMPGTTKAEDTFIYIPTPGTVLATFAMQNAAGVTYEVESVRMRRRRRDEGMVWFEVTSLPFQARNFDGMIIDTSGGTGTVTLPPNPQPGWEVGFADGSGTWDENNLTVARNGQNIEGKSEDLIMDAIGGGGNGLQVRLIYKDASRGWVLG